jgi:phosphoenolpyruvate carboxykinase (ATP)
VWLINTGWTGGPYGVGSRMKLGYTRAMVRAALSGALDGATYLKDPVFGVEIPTGVPDVPPEILVPRQTWSDPAAYDEQARKLARMFHENFEHYRTGVSPTVAAAGPIT